MRKNKIMRFASLILVLTLLSTSVISGTFAKYTTSVEVKDNARVAYWGFDQTAIADFKLFDHNDTKIVSATTDKVIAPGSTAEATFAFGYTDATDPAVTAPEVDYTFTIDVATTGTYTKLDENPNFTWYLEKNGTKVADYNTVADLVAAIKLLSGATTGTKTYTAGNLPTAFSNADEEYTVGWNWEFETADDPATPENEKVEQDEIDTAMGNMLDLNEVGITITVTATQID